MRIKRFDTIDTTGTAGGICPICIHIFIVEDPVPLFSLHLNLFFYSVAAYFDAISGPVVSAHC